MWGAQADTAPQDCTTLAGMTHVQCAAENADVQLGKILDEVKAVDAAKGGHTLVVLTADHGATYGQNFYGKKTVGAGNSNWYYAPANLGVWDAGTIGVLDKATYSNPSPDIAALNADGNVQFSYQSTAIEAWLLDHSTAANKAKAKQMLRLPGVTATYWKNAAGTAFRLQGTNRMTWSEKAWWKAHGQQIVDTMAAPDGPDVVGLLHDRTSYGVYGDHGGAQESVQRVPMVFWTPGLRANPTSESFRTPDMMPTILAAMGISRTSAHRRPGALAGALTRERGDRRPLLPQRAPGVVDRRQPAGGDVVHMARDADLRREISGASSSRRTSSRTVSAGSRTTVAAKSSSLTPVARAACRRNVASPRNPVPHWV